MTVNSRFYNAPIEDEVEPIYDILVDEYEDDIDDGFRPMPEPTYRILVLTKWYGEAFYQKAGNFDSVEQAQDHIDVYKKVMPGVDYIIYRELIKEEVTVS